MEGIRTIHIEVSSDEDFFPILKKSVVDYVLALGLPKTVCSSVEKETEKLFDEDLAWQATAQWTMEVSAEASRVTLRVRDDREEPIAQREIPVV